MENKDLKCKEKYDSKIEDDEDILFLYLRLSEPLYIYSAKTVCTILL